MPIQNIKALRTVSLTDLREPSKIIKELEHGQVAILDRNKVVAYLKHPSQERERNFSYVPDGLVNQIFAERKAEIQPVLDYLKDK
mgnify:CR=1 FL=1